MSNKGYIYVLTNPAMPGLVKIGRSINGGRKRALDLYQTGVPAPFNLHFEMVFEDVVEAESLIHERLQDQRYNKSREFFKIDPQDAAIAVVSVWAWCRDHFIVDYLGKEAEDQIHLLAYRSDTSYVDVVQAIHHVPAEAVIKAVDEEHIRMEARRLKLVSSR